MLEDQILLSLTSLFVALGAVVTVALRSQHLLTARYLLRASVGSLAVAVGVFIAAFAGSAFGWGWPDLSRTGEVLVLACGGLCFGFLYATFGWIASGRMPPLFASGLVVANIAVALIPSHYGIWRGTAFALTNFLLLSIWLTKAGPRQAVR